LALTDNFGKVEKALREKRKKISTSKLYIDKWGDIVIKGCTIRIENALSEETEDEMSITLSNNVKTIGYSGKDDVRALIADICASLGTQYDTVVDKEKKRLQKEEEKFNKEDEKKSKSEEDGKCSCGVIIEEGMKNCTYCGAEKAKSTTRVRDSMPIVTVTETDLSKDTKIQLKPLSIKTVYGIPLLLETEETFLSLSPSFEPDLREVISRA